MLLPDLALETEKQFIFDVTPIWSAPAFLGLDSFQSEKTCTQFHFGLCNTTSVYQDAIQSEFLSSLEKDLDHLLKLEEGDTTAYQEARLRQVLGSRGGSRNLFAQPYGSHHHLDATRPVRDWKGFEPLEVLNHSRLMAHVPDLPYQQGRLSNQ